MKIKINKWVEIESSNYNSINLTYEEAKTLYEELHKEFGHNAEKFWEDNKIPFEYDNFNNWDTNCGKEPAVSFEYQNYLKNKSYEKDNSY